MAKSKYRTTLSSFLKKFEQPSYLYPTNFSSGNYRKPQMILCKCRFQISIRGPAVWMDLVGIKPILIPLLLKNPFKEASADDNNVL